MNPSSSIVLQKLKDLALSSGIAKLPPVRALALTWRVSTRTVQEAVTIGVRLGWLQTRPCSGIWPAAYRPSTSPTQPRLDAVRLSETFRTEILAGKFASNQLLPGPKDFSPSLGVHPATVRKAYGLLVSQGLVDRHGRGWKVAPMGPQKPLRSPVVLCIGAAGTDGRLRMESDREWDFWREIQLEATRCGLEPVLVAAGVPLPEFDSDAFGAVVSNWHMTDTAPILDALLRLHLPTAVWVANEEVLPGKRYRQVRTLWFHDLAHGRGSGETMARYVEGLGHRKIAWISPFHASSWSQNRLQGLRSALPPSMEVFEAVHGWMSEWEVQAELSRSPSVRRRFDLKGIDGPTDPDSLMRPLVETLTRRRCLEIFTPCLESAVESGATLWVAASDLVAQWCLHWLSARGFHPPQDIALASFDDTREATRLNLTSLRFDVQSMARAMIRQVLSSREDHKRLTRHSGSVVPRASTAGFAGRLPFSPRSPAKFIGQGSKNC